jgi:signal transduction histidine kinase
LRKTQRAADVVDRIRAFSRKAQSDPAIVDGAALAQGALLLVDREAREHGVEYRLDAAPGAPKIRGDLIGLQQVLVNLLLNGIQAMAEAGSRPRRLAVSVAPNADLRRLEFRVRDSGPGIPAENRERIFAPFFSTKPNGMGMGLAICCSIVNEHGGELQIEDAEPEGACFLFSLPVA